MGDTAIRHGRSHLTATRIESIRERLEGLRQGAPGVQAAALVSIEGLMIAAALPDDCREDKLAAMSAAMLALGERIAAELGRGDLAEIYIKGRLGYVLLRGLDDQSALTILASPDARLGLLFLDMRAACDDLRGLMTA